MTAMIQADSTPVKPARPRALGTVVVVLLAHVAVLAALASLQPVALKMPETPKPMEVRFIQLEQPKPRQPEPEPAKPKAEPKPKPKPKQVKVVKQQPKPLPKPRPVLASPTVPERPQPVIAPQAAPLPEPVKPVVPEPAPQPLARPEPKPQPTAPQATAPQPAATAATPQLVEGVSYIRQPRLEISDRDLKGQARTLKLKISIAASGKVDEVQVITSSGLTALDQKVARALKRATFTPHRVNGIAVPVYTIQPFELNLSQ